MLHRASLSALALAICCAACGVQRPAPAFVLSADSGTDATPDVDPRPDVTAPDMDASADPNAVDSDVVPDAGGVDTVTSDFCDRVCASQLAFGCGNPDPIDLCLQRCRAADARCKVEADKQNECFLAHPAPWLCTTTGRVAPNDGVCSAERYGFDVCRAQ